jgi:hypothetical protein
MVRFRSASRSWTGRVRVRRSPRRTSRTSCAVDGTVSAMGMRPNLRMALREAGFQALGLLVCQAALLALGQAIGWWNFVALAVGMAAIRFAVTLRKGAQSKPVEGTHLPRHPEPPTP